MFWKKYFFLSFLIHICLSIKGFGSDFPRKEPGYEPKMQELFEKAYEEIPHSVLRRTKNPLIQPITEYMKEYVQNFIKEKIETKQLHPNFKELFLNMFFSVFYKKKWFVYSKVKECLDLENKNSFQNPLSFNIENWMFKLLHQDDPVEQIMHDAIKKTVDRLMDYHDEPFLLKFYIQNESEIILLESIWKYRFFLLNDIQARIRTE